MVGVGVSTPPRLSEVLIDTDLVMGAHAITLGAGQLVDGKDVSTLDVGDMKSIDSGQLIPHYFIKKASDTKRHGHAGELMTDQTTYQKERTFTFTNGVKGTLRFQMDIKRSGSATSAESIITKNGATPGTGDDIGVEQTETLTSYQTHSQDVAVDLNAGETVDYWLKRTGATDYALIQSCDIDYDNDIAVAVAAT